MKILLIVLGIVAAFVVIELLSFLLSIRKNRGDNFSSHDWNDQQSEDVLELKKRRGKEGEEYACDYISDLLDDGEYLLKNLLVPCKRGGQTEIDAILLSHRGIFCIEIKTWIGKVSGDDESSVWMQTYLDSGKEPVRHKNPVMQNDRHCEILEEYLNDDLIIENLVLLLRSEDREDLHSEYVYSLEEFEEAYEKTSRKRLNDEAIKRAYSRLKKWESTEEEIDAFHERMKRKFKDR